MITEQHIRVKFKVFDTSIFTIAPLSNRSNSVADILLCWIPNY